jgi:hypothetical protein
MSKKSKGLVAAAAAFAASPQGQRFIRQLKDYASNPENREKLQRMMDQAKSKRKGTTGAHSGTSSPS